MANQEKSRVIDRDHLVSGIARHDFAHAQGLGRSLTERDPGEAWAPLRARPAGWQRHLAGPAVSADASGPIVTPRDG